MPTPLVPLVAVCCVSASGRKFVQVVESRQTFARPLTGSTFFVSTVVEAAPPEIGANVPVPHRRLSRGSTRCRWPTPSGSVIGTIAVPADGAAAALELQRRRGEPERAGRVVDRRDTAAGVAERRQLAELENQRAVPVQGRGARRAHRRRTRASRRRLTSLTCALLELLFQFLSTAAPGSTHDGSPRAPVPSWLMGCNSSAKPDRSGPSQ